MASKKLKAKYGGSDGIHAYDDAAAGHKARFLADARSLLVAVGKVLAAHGYTANVRVNKAGVAVGGDVYADYKLDATSPYFNVCVTASCMQNDERKDGVVIYTQIRTPRPNGSNSITGGNYYHSTRLDSDELAADILRHA